MTRSSGPLSGVRVIELAHVAAGPFAGMLLADLGADVVKVEPPCGDQLRGWPPFADDGHEAFSYNFASVNRAKRSVVADLSDPRQRAHTRQLIDTADVLIENYRPGALRRWGLGYDDVTAGHRGLVYCSLSGFGHTSPYAEWGAYDVVVQAMSGLMSVTGQPGGPIVKAGVPFGDFTAGLFAAYSIAAFLPQVRRTGRSVHLDVPMLDSLLAVSAFQTSEYWGTGVEPQRLGTAHPRNAPYQAFHAADGQFAIAAGNDRLWAAVAELTGLDSADPRFVTQPARVAHQQELAQLLQDVFGTAPRAHWLDLLQQRGVPCGPVNTYGQILADPHTAPLIHHLDQPVAGSTPGVGFPVRVDSRTLAPAGPAPRLGVHTAQVANDWLASPDIPDKRGFSMTEPHPPTISWDEPAGGTARGTVILLPGRGDRPAGYQRFGRRLALDGYRVRYVDLDWHSDAPGLAERQVATLLADESLPAPRVLVGSDAGAALALSLAAAADAAVVAGVALPCSAPVGEEEDLDARSACPVHRATIADTIDRVPDGLSIRVPDLLNTVARVSRPVLVIHGSDDIVTPVDEVLRRFTGNESSDGQFTTDPLPRPQVRVVTGGRHEILNDVSHRSVAATIVLFLESLRVDPQAAQIVHAMHPAVVA